jgi:hypothetical protein
MLCGWGFTDLEPNIETPPCQSEWSQLRTPSGAAARTAHLGNEVSTTSCTTAATPVHRELTLQ